MPAQHRARPSESFVEWIKANRNLFLFVSVILVIVMLPLFEHSDTGELLFTSLTMFIIVVAAATNGESRVLFWSASALATPAIAGLLLASFTSDSKYLVLAWIFAAAVHFATIARLLHDVFAARSITRDTLFACANVYLLFGVSWCYLYALLVHFNPGALPDVGGLGTGPRSSLHVADLMYFSFNVVLQVALTNVVPATKGGQVLVLLQELAAVLYMAFVISRLVGLYAPTREPQIEVDVTTGETNGPREPR